MNGNPFQFEVFSDSVDDCFLCVGKVDVGEVKAKECFATVGAKSASQVFCFYIEEIADDAGSESVEKLPHPRNVFCFDTAEAIGNDHIVRFFQNGGEYFVNVLGIKLSVGVDVYHNVRTVFEGTFHGTFERVSETTVRLIGNDDVGSGVFGNLRGLVG